MKKPIIQELRTHTYEIATENLSGKVGYVDDQYMGLYVRKNSEEIMTFTIEMLDEMEAIIKEAKQIVEAHNVHPKN